MSTLAGLADEIRAGKSFPDILGDFLDAFYRQPDAIMLQDEPASLSGISSEGEMLDAYLGGIVERLARAFRMPIPEWVFRPSRYLHHPYFGSEASALRATLLIESPAEFRSRNIFVTANALDRASRYR